MRNTFIRLLLLPFSFIIGSSKYREAIKLEKEKKHKDACYTYAIAILNGGVINEKAIRNKIKTLWVQYGPFNYEEDLRNEISKGGGDTPEHCMEAGHAAVMSIIEESIK